MVTKAGVKLVDFGLAKAAVPAVVASGLSVLATTPANVTAPGRILGTLQYMSPEQVEGVEADARTDIFSFGAMLFEMVTGRKAFSAKSAAGLLGAILKDQPPPSARCSPSRRARWIASSRPASRRIPTTAGRARATCAASSSGLRTGRRSARGADVHDRPARRWWLVATLAAAAALAGVASGWHDASVARAGCAHAVGRSRRRASATARRIAVSRDAHAIVYEALRPDGVQQLFVRRRDQLEPVPMRGTEGAVQLAVSPDEAWMLFVAAGSCSRFPSTAAR